MHGLVNLAMELYLRETFGAQMWHRIAGQAALPFQSFEPLIIYDIALTVAVIDAASALLDRPADAILEDLGTYIVSSASGERLRRLLRFGGVGFRDFLHSLEELPARARLALPDFHLPDMVLTEMAEAEFTLALGAPFGGAGYVMIGLLRAMADDYGALALLEMRAQAGDGDVISIHVLDEGYAAGRRFDLAVGALSRC
ncbi:MAG: heme NO-binding domain-containing protein [Rhodobacteraceae bacterium]|nr:heme NO-binding domain-containing protein [Paracoccaceae bacterium]MCF8516335.1 heme NO-binding domain-containing protein [Paracoccaceae bacterium]MCF8520685.1 heme NO-binding domain-containing protein [Paracoccaceae bacterium]